MDPSAPEPRAETAGKGLWHPGERCLVPPPDDERPCEASTKSVSVGARGEPFAAVSHPDCQERKAPPNRLQGVKPVKDCSRNFIFDDEDLEKPYFPDRELPSSAAAFPFSEGGAAIPYTINRYLRDYQRAGAQFLYGHFIRGRGCILGDDMGLGKTVQVISFLAAVLHKKGTREDIENNMPEFLLRSLKKEPAPSVAQKMFLIVAPLSVLYNWRDELDTWGYFRVTILHGNKKDSELIRVKQRKCEIALTTYETLRLCLDELNSLEWSAVIVDEAHRIKNPQARVTEVMKALTCGVRIGLTGTILQNNMRELWCVMDWAVPGLLGSRTHFKKQFSDPVEHGQRHTATKRELATGRKAMRRLAKKMSGWFLRRTKALIQDQLPKKEDRMVYCSLTDFQKAVYQTVLETEDVALILQSSQPCTCSSGRKRRNCCYKTNSHGETVKALYFSYLAVLQKVANHAALLQAAGTSKQQETLIKRICDQVFSRFPDFVQKSKDAAFETLSDPKYSGKMKVLQQLLNHCRKSKAKVLLFSFSTKLLDVLQQYCMASGLDYRRLDGSTKSEERLRVVKEFNSVQDVNICLVSTMAGGLGLNFVGANVVVLFDPTWNPANDLQAIDRAYRIGQCRDVKVFRLISLGTVEEIMYLRQVYKQQLHCVVVGSENAKRYFEAVQGSKEHRGELFGVCNLFRLRPQGSCLTKDILEREGQVEAGVLTATTWLREEPADHKLRTPGEPECHRHGGREQPAVPSAKDSGDLCSDFSEDESVRDSRAKPTKGGAAKLGRASGSPGQLTLLQCGFSKLLETKCQAAEGSDENTASDDESPGEQPTCLSTESNDVSCPKSRGSLGPSKQQKLTSIRNPNEKCIFNKSEKILEQNVSSESDDEEIFENAVDWPRVVQTATESEDSDVVLPTQCSAERVPETSRRCKPPAGETEDSETQNPVKMRDDVDEGKTSVRGDGLISKQLNPEDVTLTSRRKRKGSSDISDESDDIEMSFEPRVRKRRATGSLGFRRQKENKREIGTFSKRTKEANRLCAADEGCSSQAIEDFPSSDEDFPVSHVSFSKQGQRHKTIKDRVAFSSKLPSHEKNSTSVPRKPVKFSSERVVSQEQVYESMDKFLDGVQEVAYIHSNQNVIGSSKAENHMSRWATRDVFELKQFSQLPANLAVCTAKTHKEKMKADTVTPTKEGQQPREGDISFPLHISHPVRQKKKKVYRTDQTTFIIGETPKGTRRKQFEEMASYFNLSSVKEFAAHVTNATSEERQRMLRDFYASQHPEVGACLVDCAAALREPARERGARTRRQADERAAPTTARPPGNEAPSGAGPSKNASRTRSRKTHEERRTTPQTCGFGKGVLPDGADAQKTPASSTREAAGGEKGRGSLNSSAEGASEVAMNGRQDPAGPGVSDTGHERMESPALGDASVAGLLGDTSILDDLFRSHGNSPTRLPKKVPSGPVEKARQRPKDFWDILNEQNGDSLSKLTDLAVIETLCDRAPRAAPSRSKEALEASLWKANENFLWRKFQSGDPDEDTAHAQE